MKIHKQKEGDKMQEAVKDYNLPEVMMPNEIYFTGIEVESAINRFFYMSLDKLPYVQGVILRLIGDAYLIITAVPPDNKRHGLCEMGHLRKDKEKTLLLDALIKRKLQHASHAVGNEKVAYMKEHIDAKGIAAVAALPLRAGKLKYLVIFDRMLPGLDEFSQSELDELSYGLKQLQKHINRMVCGMNGSADNILRQGDTKDISHYLRNHVIQVGGFARRLSDLINDDPEISALTKEKIKKYADIIKQVASDMEEDFALWREFSLIINSKHETGEANFNEYLDFFHSDNGMECELDIKATAEAIVDLPVKCLEYIFGQLAKYLKKDARKFKVKTDLVNDEISLIIDSPAFDEYKYDHRRLALIRPVVEDKLFGKFELDDKTCIITIPYSIE